MPHLRRQILGSFVVTLSVVTMIALLSSYYASQWLPRFYRDKLGIAADRLVEHGQEMEARVFGLHHDMQDCDRWQVVFTDNQINGWLAIHLPQKFPRLLPWHIRDPRVAIDAHLAKIACRYENGNTQAVLSLVVDTSLTDDPNVVAVRILDTRIGVIPCLTKRAMYEISMAARRSGIRLRWTQIDHDPVALVTIPEQLFEAEPPHQIQLDKIELREGHVLLAGRTVEAKGANDQVSLRRVSAAPLKPAAMPASSVGVHSSVMANIQPPSAANMRHNLAVPRNRWPTQRTTSSSRVSARTVNVP